MGKRVEKFKTPVSEAEMAQAMIQAWEKIFGSKPAKEQIALLLAQNALETGHRKSMWNYNVGNITTTSKSPYDYFDTLPTSEQISPGKWKKMNLKYRAYPDLLTGTIDYIKFLSKNNRYSQAWQHILKPDPVSFSKALKAASYYTANEPPYTKALKSIFDKYVKENKEKNNLKLPLKQPSSEQPSSEQQLESEASFNKLNEVLDIYLYKTSLFQNYFIK